MTTRAGAILWAAVAASGEVGNVLENREALGISIAAIDLYWAAWRAARRALPDLDALDPVLDAEAAALLEDGWSPGDPVERR